MSQKFMFAMVFFLAALVQPIQGQAQVQSCVGYEPLECPIFDRCPENACDYVLPTEITEEDIVDGVLIVSYTCDEENLDYIPQNPSVQRCVNNGGNDGLTIGTEELQARCYEKSTCSANCAQTNQVQEEGSITVDGRTINWKVYFAVCQSMSGPHMGWITEGYFDCSGVCENTGPPQDP